VGYKFIILEVMCCFAPCGIWVIKSHSKAGQFWVSIEWLLFIESAPPDLTKVISRTAGTTFENYSRT